MGAFTHITITEYEKLEINVEDGRDMPWLYLAAGRVTVHAVLTDAVKDQLRQIVRDWDFAEEAKLHDAEEAQGYPIGQTLKTFLGVPLEVKSWPA